MENGRIFLLSPAHTGGRRAKLLLRTEAGFELARRFQSQGAPVGEVFAFVSGLYFRGKMAYASRFGNPPPGLAKSLVITADRGLLDPAAVITTHDFEAMSSVPVDATNAAYSEPLVRDALTLASASCEFVLLGSVATAKYLWPLTSVFGKKLLVPTVFPGRGDMSRGALMLQAAKDGIELPYICADQLPKPLR